MIHVLFSPSAGGTLKQLLQSRGSKDRVVALTECLDWGWISSEPIEDRVRWFDETAGLDWDWLADCGPKFLAEIAAEEDRLIWVAPRSAQEQSGLYWLMHQIQNPPTQLIIADYPLEGAWRGEPPKSLGELGPEMMAQLVDKAPRLEWDDSRFPINKWRSLMDEGAVLRIVEEGVLQSARSDHYDDWLLRWCPSGWTKWYRVVGDAMGHASQPISDLFLKWRLQELITLGAIECDGSLPSWDMPTTVEPARVRRSS